MLSPLPSPALHTVRHYLCSGLGEGDLENPSQEVTGAPVLHSWVSSHSLSLPRPPSSTGVMIRG